jgi:hypothetical protein
MLHGPVKKEHKFAQNNLLIEHAKRRLLILQLPISRIRMRKGTRVGMAIFVTVFCQAANLRWRRL